MINNFLPRELPNPRDGSSVVLHNNELITLLLFNSIVAPQRTMKAVYTWAQVIATLGLIYQLTSSWVRKYHDVLPDMLVILDQLLVKDASTQFMDSTILEVCMLVRADRHKVAKGVTDFGKNWQGWHYGFKLHASCNLEIKKSIYLLNVFPP